MAQITAVPRSKRSAMKSCPQWYLPVVDDKCLNPAAEAYRRACCAFRSSLPAYSDNATLISSSSSINDILDIVEGAKHKYDDSVRHPGWRKWLSRFSRRVTYYANVLDTFVQHHPEYVALAWGAMKVLFVLVENHDKKIQALARALSQIADCLPRAELATILYPTEHVKTAVAELYAHVLTFCVRAKEFYEAGRLKHALQSFTQPVELEYADIVEDIVSCSQRIQYQAEAGGQAEQRDIHLLLLKVAERQEKSDAIIEQLQTKLQECQGIILNGQVNTTTQLRDLQLNQILDYVTATSRYDELASLQACTYSRRRRQRSSRHKNPIPIWSLPKVQAWNRVTQSSVLITATDRQKLSELQDCFVDVIHYLREQKVPVIWVMNNSGSSNSVSSLTTLDIFKSIAGQALRLCQNTPKSRGITFTCQQFRCAETEEDWIRILSNIAGCFSVLYVVVDLYLLDHASSPLGADFSWACAFGKLFETLSSHGHNTRVKVIMVKKGMRYTEEERSSANNFCVSVATSGRSTAAIRRSVPARSSKSRKVGVLSKLDLTVT